MPTNDYPPDWDSRRKKIYSRDGHQCQNCGVYGGLEGDAELHAHHIVPKSKGGTHDTTNLITICKQCHMAVHGDKNAPIRKSNKKNSIDYIDDMSDFVLVQEQYTESRDMISGALSIPIGDLQGYSDYKIMKDNSGLTDIIKTTKEQLTECRFRLEKININYSEVAKLVENSDRSEVESIIQNHASLMLRDIELLLQGSNLSLEYINTISVVICPRCEKESNPQDSFCGECGEDLPNIWSCSDCGAHIDSSTQKFCKSCGSNISSFPKNQKDIIVSLRNRTGEIIKQINDHTEEIGDFSHEVKRVLS